MKIRIVLSSLVAAGLMFGSIQPSLAGAAATYEQDVRHETNKRRAYHDLRPVKYQRCVDKWAERQARWMAEHRTMKHQDLRRVLRDCNLRSVGENIAAGYPNGHRVVKAWMKSSGHRANILTPKYRLIGIGAKRDKNGRWWVAQVFGSK